MTQRFLDLFSRQAAAYAAARPRYPVDLLDFLASGAPGRRLAWDCATGNGQAAVDLSRRFDRVIATDASAEQVARAAAARNVTYWVATADASGLPDRRVELVTVAQALHWLDIEAFAREVRRVTVPGALVAAWCYGACHAGRDVEPLVREFEHGTLGPFWHAARRWVDEGYRTIPFPFDELPAPGFEMRVRWTLPQFGAYLSSWSAVAKYRDATRLDPVRPLMEQLANHWGPPGAVREITWPLGVRVGRIT